MRNLTSISPFFIVKDLQVSIFEDRPGPPPDERLHRHVLFEARS
jgi:hypothetical protein